jgi:hypothetical protein
MAHTTTATDTDAYGRLTTLDAEPALLAGAAL